MILASSIYVLCVVLWFNSFFVPDEGSTKRRDVSQTGRSGGKGITVFDFAWVLNSWFLSLV